MEAMWLTSLVSTNWTVGLVFHESVNWRMLEVRSIYFRPNENQHASAQSQNHVPIR